MSYSYLHSLLDSISSMDIERLGFILKDEYSYQGTTKEIFLEKLDEIFRDFRKEGDTKLLSHKGCCGNEECDNCGIGGYRFVGNHSKNYLDLLFEQRNDDVVDIRDCSSFKTEKDIAGLNYSTSIYIHRDEENDFPKTPEYWSKVEAASKAYDEIYANPTKPLTFEEIEYWLEKHAYTIDSIGKLDIFSPRMRWTPFTSLYEQLNELLEYVNDYKEELADALASFKTIRDEEGLLEWLVRYEDLNKKVPFHFKYNLYRAGECYTQDVTNPLLFTGSVLMDVFGFVEDFYKKHGEMLEKYSTYDDSEISEIFGDKKYAADARHVFSLRFHLERRKECAELGIEIPLFIAKATNGSEMNNGEDISPDPDEHGKFR